MPERFRRNSTEQFNRRRFMRPLYLYLSAAALALTGTTVALADHHGSKQSRDADGNGVISTAEHNAHADAVFARMDVNSDGVIDAADRELRKAQKFAETDANNDGEISLAEMQAAREARSEQRQTRRAGRLAERFAKLDTDGSGGVSEAEMEAGKDQMREKRGKRGKRGDRAGGGKRGGGKAMRMLRQADTNGDKAISRAEFDTAMAQRFAKMDSDGDGNVTEAERKAARDAIRASRPNRGEGRRGQ
jgi:hypothetical protein